MSVMEMIDWLQQFPSDTEIRVICADDNHDNDPYFVEFEGQDLDSKYDSANGELRLGETD